MKVEKWETSKYLRQQDLQFAFFGNTSNHPRVTTQSPPCVDRLSTTRVVEAQNSQLGFVQGKSQYLSGGAPKAQPPIQPTFSLSGKPMSTLAVSQPNSTQAWYPNGYDHWISGFPLPRYLSRIRKKKRVFSASDIESLSGHRALYFMQYSKKASFLASTAADFKHHEQTSKNGSAKHHRSNFICSNHYATKPTICFSFHSPCCVPQLAYYLQTKQTHYPSIALFPSPCQKWQPHSKKFMHAFTKISEILPWKSLEKSTTWKVFSLDFRCRSFNHQKKKHPSSRPYLPERKQPILPATLQAHLVNIQDLSFQSLIHFDGSGGITWKRLAGFWLGTLPETAFWPLKINGWKMNFLLRPGLFSGANC